MPSVRLSLLFLAATLLQVSFLRAKDPSPTETELRTLRLTIEKQSLQIDALTREVERLGHLIEGSPRAGATAAPSASQTLAEPAAQTNGAAIQTHIVGKGETLTSIAKQYKISVSELQDLNKIEDGRKLRAGQNLMIPAAKSETPATSKPEIP